MAAARLKAPKPEGAHAIERAWERYGLFLTTADLTKMAELVQQNHGKLLSRQTNGRSEWLLMFKRQILRVVVDATLYYIVTVLPTTHTPPKRKGRVKLYSGGESVWVG